MRTKLSFKFIFISVLVIIVVMIGVAVSVVNLERKTLLEKAEKTKEVLLAEKNAKTEILLNNLISKGEGLISFIAQIAPESIRTFDFARIDGYVSEICKDKEVLYAACYDKDGKVLTLGEVLDPSDDILELKKKCIDKYGVDYGTVKIGLTKKYLKQALAKTDAGINKVISQTEKETNLALKRVFRRILTLFIIGILILSIVLHFAFDRMVIKPIYRVSGTLNDIAKGNFHKRIEIKTHDEIGGLAAAFNKMAEDLQKTTVSRDELAHEVNKRKRTEEELKKYRSHLEEMIEQRTKELQDAQEELVKREKLSVLGRLTAIVSHDLRNPLGVIRSSAYYLETKLKNADGKITKHLKRIEEKVIHCVSIVNELLEYNRGQPPDTTMMELNPWIETVLDDVEIPAQVTMARELSPDISKFPFDKEKLRRVVVNLVENAIQAVNARQENWNEDRGPYQPEVILNTSLVENGVCIEVKDNGIGMDEETAGRAFEPLFTTKARGSGLGLAIVLKIVKEHGGSVSLNSELGRGTKATVVIPIKNREAIL